MTPEQIKEAVLNEAWENANADGDYLFNLITWAYRDHTAEDYADEYAIINEGRD